jgi:hypothetical protein
MSMMKDNAYVEIRGSVLKVREVLCYPVMEGVWIRSVDLLIERMWYF